MPLLSMNQITTYRWSFRQDIDNYQEAGYQSIGVWRRKLSDEGEEEAVELVAQSGLQVSNLLWAGGFTGSDGHTFEESVDDAAEALRLAAALAAGCLVVFPGGRNNHTFRHAERLLRSALDALLPLAEVVEVPLAIKPTHVACAASCSFITDLEGVVTLIEDFRSPWLKLAYDTYHFPFNVRQQHRLIALAPYIGIVHLADGRRAPGVEDERCPLGTGRLPLGTMIATLLEAGYTGPFDVKLIGPEIEPNDYWLLLERSQLAFHQFAKAPISRTPA